MSHAVRWGAFLVAFHFILSAQAADKRTFAKTGPNTATVKIETEAKDSIQAADYVDGLENRKFIEMMIADKTSTLAKLKAKIEMDQCQENSTTPDGWIPMCGRFEVTDLVRTGFERGGWMEAGAAYTFFIGFRFAGTGQMLETYSMATISEDVAAEVDSQMEYKGVIKKSLTLQRIVAIPVK